MCVMEQVGVRELRQNISVYLRQIQDDQRPLEVTDRGRPVAVLTPLGPAADDYAALEAAGRLRPADLSWSTYSAPAGEVTTSGSDALEALREERL